MKYESTILSIISLIYYYINKNSQILFRIYYDMI